MSDDKIYKQLNELKWSITELKTEIRRKSLKIDELKEENTQLNNKINKMNDGVDYIKENEELENDINDLMCDKLDLEDKVNQFKLNSKKYDKTISKLRTVIYDLENLMNEVNKI